MANKESRKSFLASTTITLLIVAMLILSGPAQAVSVMISGLQGSYTQGDSINFRVTIEINEPDQNPPMTDISII